ncbi:MAG: glycerate kinase [Lachnospiraceae bacterium]|nr:glycerate kinase [Lachnospiraceae bacterium]
MSYQMRRDAERIIGESIAAVLPDRAVKEALQGKVFARGRLYVVAVGKAGWQMAGAACNILGDRIYEGICITKYGHVKGSLERIRCLEAGHPLPDHNSFAATEAVLRMVEGLSADDTVLFLLSGGGSALFEKPLIPGEELADITKQLLDCGADIVEINTIRKRLSAVKGGRFAEACAPAKIYSIVLSDIPGDPPDMIASGPAWPDESRSAHALAVAEKYGLKLSEAAARCLRQETVKSLTNVETLVTGNVDSLCLAACESCRKLGYNPLLLTNRLSCEAKEAGAFLSAIAKTHQSSEKSLAFIAGGETVVHVTGQGKGGRNQELALAAAEGIAGLENTAVFSVGSDGTDGPTDAAGGYCDGRTKDRLTAQGIQIHRVLCDNDAYTALAKTDGLIVTGPTGTNVNDVAVVLIRR